MSALSMSALSSSAHRSPLFPCLPVARLEGRKASKVLRTQIRHARLLERCGFD